MKKTLSLLTLILFFLSLSPVNLHASDTGYFIVTAYYSPLPDQDYYITGSYELEKRLNGNGIAGASGKNVFSGMLAAPGKYPFGTKIQLDGLGIGAVEDRGGAIVPAGERGYGHDRIDVWVGYGDEGLRRAMYWGKRKVEGKVVSSDTASNLDYNSIPAPSWAVPKTTLLYGNKVQVFQESAESETDISDSINIFNLSLGIGSDEKYIIELQNILREIAYYTPTVSSGLYDTQTIDAVYNFQINNNIVDDEQTVGAGSYGPKTRKKLQEIYNLHLKQEEIKAGKIAEIEAYKIESYDIASTAINTISDIKYGDISPDVRKIQKLLRETGYFDYKDTAIFGVKTRNAILSFQLDNQVISDETDTGAGVFGPKTREQLSAKIGEENFKQILEVEGLLELYNTVYMEDIQEISHENNQSNVVTNNIIYSI